MLLHFLRFVLIAGPLATAVAAPVINEIMFRPGTGLPENTAEEFIEILNPDGAPVDVGGYRFTTGVDFTIPAPRTIPAGGHLVICAHLPSFQAKYPGVNNVVGGWIGSLANSGERITLVDAGGLEVDQVSYADEGDWATRIREQVWLGWDWSTLADGGGSSLELRQPQLTNNNGQNWLPSLAANGTPGAANSRAAANVAPLIENVHHNPAVPTSTDNVVISCELEDELATGLTATLYWRVSSGSPPAFTTTPMIGDGTGEFSATLGPRADKTIIEFYIEASDGTSTRTWPAPTDGPNAADRGQLANCTYQVDNEVPPAGQPLYRLVLTAAENSAFQQVNPGSDRQFNMTFIAVIGGDPDVRYRSSMRIRGASSRSHDPRPLRISIPRDERWNGISGFNLNPKYSWLQYMATKLFLASGLPANDAKPVHVRRNGVDHARGDGYDYGRWAHIEDVDSDYAENHFPLDPNGNLYKKVRPDNNWAYRNGDVGAYLGDGWSKQTNSAADDWSDLDTFLGAMNANPAGATYLSDIEAVADLDQWMDWFALETIIANRETNASNGADDDYSMYRGELDPRFKFLPHDLDTVFGEGDTGATPDHTLFDMTSSGDVLEPLVPFFQVASIRQRYFQSLRRLCQTTFAAARFDPFLDNHLGGWVPAGTRSNIKNWMAQRCAFIESTIAPELGPPTPPTAPTTSNSLSSPHGTLFISEVLAKNVAAQGVGGAFPDLIELRNTGPIAVNLAGKSITDTPDVKDKFVFPTGSSIPVGGYLVLYADAGTGPGYLGFEIESEGDQVLLYDTPGSGQALIDAVSFGPQAADFSIGRTGAALDLWRLCQPTFGGANVTQNTGSVTGVVINEWLANPRVRVKSDFIELFNPAALPVALGGLRLTDDFANFPDQHSLPALSFISPQGFAVFQPKGAEASAGKPSELPFKFSAVSGWAAILGENGVLIDQADTDCQFPDVSRGRQPDGATALADFVIPTPGRPNVAPTAATVALLDRLRITEIHYNPLGGNDFEFIELKNISTTATLSLAGVRFTDGIDYVFPAGATLAPNAFLVLVRHEDSFQSRYPTVPVGGVFTGTLDNSGEPIALTLPLPDEVNILFFEFEDGWHPTTDGDGFALELIDPVGTLPQDFDKKSKWGASGQLHGTPGSSGPPIITSPLNATGTLGDPFSYQIAGTNGPTQFNAIGLPAGLTVNTNTGLISGTPTASGSFAPLISATNVGGAGSATLSLTIAASGPLHHLTWANIASPKNAGIPFAVEVVARDSQERVVIDATSNLSLSGQTGTGVGSPILITEFNGSDPDFFEIQNVSNQTANTTGWFVVMNHAGMASQGVNHVHPGEAWDLPPTMAVGEIATVADGAIYGYDFPSGQGVLISVTYGRGWILISNPSGQIMDFVAWGYTAAELATLNVSVRGFNFTVGSQWSGNGMPNPNNFAGNRTGNEDNNSAADWSTGPATPNAQNSGLVTPFELGEPVSINPTAATLFGGRWVGFVTIGAQNTGVSLRAATNLGIAGTSNTFDVAAPPPDTDSDGMPNAWETANGLSTSVNDAALDKDADGQSNLAEYRAGTNPSDAQSVLKLLAASRTPAGQVTLNWTAVAGKVYRVLHSTALTGWTEVAGTRRIATGATESAIFTDPTPTGARAFFKVELMTNN